MLKKIFLRSIKVSCLLTCLFFVYSCTNNSVAEIFVSAEDFPRSIKLVNGKKLKFDQLSPSSLNIIDSLIVVSSYVENPRLSIYNNSLNLIGGFGFIGRGPNEYSAPEWNGQFFSKSSNPDKIIYIYEFGYGLIHEVNFSAILRKDDNFKIEKYYLPPEVMNAGNVFFVNDTLYGEATYNHEVKYFKHKLGSNAFIPIGQFNDSEIVKNEKSIDKRVNLDRSFLSYSSVNSKFVAAYLRFNKIVIMDRHMNEELVIYYGKEKKAPMNHNFTSRDNIYYFRKPFAGKDHIYVPYVGVKNSDRTYPNELHVYDYSGHPIKRFIFDEIFTSFTIDEEKKKLYIITNSAENQYTSYDL